MVQEMLPLLPKDLGTTALLIALGGTVAGLGLWLVGARFSRPLISLIAVAAGGLGGMELPKYIEVPLQPMAVAMSGALGLGLLAFLFHRFFVGVGLGLVLACWGALGSWLFSYTGSPWTWPTATPESALWGYLAQVWASLPQDMRTYMPLVSAGALIAGTVLGIAYTKLGVVLLHSLAGVSLLVGMGLAVMECQWPQGLNLVPTDQTTQLVSLLALVAVGAGFQWYTTPAAEADGKGSPKGKGKEAD